jgi:hypothetical protein
LVSALPATIEAAQEAADAAMTEAQAKVASVTLGATIPEGVSFGTDTKNPALTIQTSLASSAEGSAQLITGGAAHTLATHYSSVAGNAAVDTVKAISLGSLDSSTQGSYVSVTTEGTVGTGLTVKVDDTGLASTVSAAASAIQTVKVNGTALSATNNAVDITAIVGVDEKATNGIRVAKTSDNKVEVKVESAQYDADAKGFSSNSISGGYFTTAAAVTSAISDAVGAIVIPDVEASESAKKLGFEVGTHESTSNHYIHLATATYAGDTETPWQNKGYLVTGSTVETFVGAETAKALAEAKAYSESLHTTSVDYVVADTLPTVESGKEEEFKGKIYLVLTGIDGVVAADGARIEYMYVQENGVWGWEQIGTTTADLSGYAKSVTINGTKYEASAANAGSLNLGTVVTSIEKTTEAAPEENLGTVHAHINNGALYLGVASATDTVMGVSKMFTGNLQPTIESTVTDTSVSVKSASAMYDTLADMSNAKIAKIEASGDKLTGLTVSVTTGSDSTDKTSTISVTNGVINSGSLPATAKVVANGLIDGTDVIETEKIVFTDSDDVATIQAFIPADAQLTTWVGDMPNLESGYEMFSSCAILTTFIGDLSSLKHGNQMFNGCALTTFIGDLSSLEHGDNMFAGCKLSTETALEIVETLPTYTSGVHKITISVTSGPSALLAEITELAESKGWEADLSIAGGDFS